MSVTPQMRRLRAIALGIAQSPEMERLAQVTIAREDGAIIYLDLPLNLGRVTWWPGKSSWSVPNHPHPSRTGGWPDLLDYLRELQPVAIITPPPPRKRGPDPDDVLDDGDDF